MAITNLYPNLPGHLVEFKDGGMQLRSTAVTGNSKSLLILGTATDGPVNEPVAIDAESVHKLFGNDVDSNGIPNGATITKYARQAFKAGFNDIRCMRVTGSPATAKIVTSVATEKETVENTVVLTANGNKRTTVDLSVGTIPSGKYAAIKNINISHPITSGAVSYTYGKKDGSNDGYIAFPEGTFPARQPVTVNYTVQTVDSAAKQLVGQGAVDLNGGTNTVAPHFEMPTDVYFYDMTGLNPDSATEDIQNVPVTNLVPVTVQETGETKYASIALTLTTSDGTVVNPVITKAVLEADNELIITIETDSAVSAGEYMAGSQYTMNYISYTSSDETFNVTQAELYEAIEVVLDADKAPATGEEVVLYNNATGNVVAKLSDANVITYNSVDNKFVVDLSAVPVTVPVSYITPGAALTLAYAYEVEEQITDSIVFETIYGGTVYNEAKLTVDLIVDKDGNEGRLITLTKPESKKYSTTEAPLTFSSFDYPTVGALRDALDAHALNNVFKLVVDNEEILTGTIPVGAANSVIAQFEGGTNGVNPTNDEMFVALSGKRDADGYLIKSGAYQVLENYNVDNIYVAGVYADSKVSPSISKNGFHYELALLCAVLTYRTKMVHGYIDFKPNTNTTLVGIQSYVEKLLKYDNTHYMKDAEGNVIYDENNSPMDIGWYTSAVVGPEPICTSPTLGTYYGSPAIAYAALNANLKAQSAPTNKALPGCTGMRYKFSNKQLNDLVSNRLVVFKSKNDGVANATTIPHVVDGCTCGATGSDYTRLTTVKVVTRCVDEVREVSDPFIGEPNTVEQRNALAALISKRLTYLKEQGVIQYFEFEISATVEQVLLGECAVALTLVAPQELRKITTVVSLRASA